MVEECEALLREIVAREKQCEATLTRRRDEAAVRLKGFTWPGRPAGRIPRVPRTEVSQLDLQVNLTMNNLTPSDDPMLLDDSADLETVLAAWHAATVRLEQTHEALRDGGPPADRRAGGQEPRTGPQEPPGRPGPDGSHVAHEVRNNLVPVTLYLSLLRRRIADDPGSLDMLDKIAAGFAALDATVNDLLHFTSDRDPQLQTFPLRQLVEDVAGVAGPAVRGPGDPAGDRRAAATLHVTADRDMIRRAVLNLVLNALDAMPDGGTLTIALRRARRTASSWKSPTPGRACRDDALRRAFEPFFTTKPGGTAWGWPSSTALPRSTAATVARRESSRGGAPRSRSRICRASPCQEAAA